jgi:hypothetical protein
MNKNFNFFRQKKGTRVIISRRLSNEPNLQNQQKVEYGKTQSSWGVAVVIATKLHEVNSMEIRVD